ncbi:hypothetical protein ACJZ2D_001269 [Fusarium nematophilum]
MAGFAPDGTNSEELTHALNSGNESEIAKLKQDVTNLQANDPSSDIGELRKAITDFQLNTGNQASRLKSSKQSVSRIMPSNHVFETAGSGGTWLAPNPANLEPILLTPGPIICRVHYQMSTVISTRSKGQIFAWPLG